MCQFLWALWDSLLVHCKKWTCATRKMQLATCRHLIQDCSSQLQYLCWCHFSMTEELLNILSNITVKLYMNWNDGTWTSDQMHSILLVQCIYHKPFCVATHCLNPFASAEHCNINSKNIRKTKKTLRKNKRFYWKSQQFYFRSRYQISCPLNFYTIWSLNFIEIGRVDCRYVS